MKRHITLAMTLVVAVVTACSGSGGDDPTTTAPADTSAEATITIADFSFSDPGNVSLGETVTVSNDDSVSHTWTADDGEFDSGSLASGDTFEFTFDEAGEFDFHCSIHPQMTGSITVEG